MARLPRTRALAAAVAALALGAACGLAGADNDDSTSQDDPEPGSLAEWEAWEDSAPSCDQLAGQPTSEVLDDARCHDGDTVQLFMWTSWDCPDGRALVWNDFGWGYSDGAWQAHERADGQLVPPDADLDACQP